MTGYNIRTAVILLGAVATKSQVSVTKADVGFNVSAMHDKSAISADSFARALVYTIGQPDDADINEILFRPIAQEY